MPHPMLRLPTLLLRLLPALALLLVLSLAAPLRAQEDRLTPADVDEVAQLLDALIAGSARYGEAESQARQMMGYVLADFGENSRQAIQIERILVLTAVLQGRPDEGLSRGLALVRKAQGLLPADDPLIYRTVSACALALRVAGRPAEALSLASEALTEADARLPGDDLAVDELRLTQALLATALDDTALAEEAFRRLDERLGNRDEPDAMAMRTMGMIGWADLVTSTGDLERGIALYRAALAAFDAQFASLKHPRMVPARLAAVRMLAEALIDAGHRDEVEPLLRPLMEEVVQVYGPDAPLWADLAFPLAIVLGGTEPGAPRAPEAVELLGRVVTIWEAVYGPEVEDMSRARMSYAMLLASAGQIAGALEQIDRAHGSRLPGARLQMAYVLHEAVLAGDLTQEQAVDAVLRLLQDSQGEGAAAAQRLLAERLAAGSDAAAAALRARTDAKGRLSSLQAQMVQLANLPLDQRDAGDTAAVRAAVKAAQAASDAAETRIRQEFPALASATGQLPLSLAGIRARLGPDEALVLIDAPRGGVDNGLIVAVSREAVDWHTFQAEGAEVDAAVAAVRRGIDLRLGLRGAAALDDEAGAPSPPGTFDYAAAHWIYAQTLGQVEGVIAGKSHLLLDLRGSVSALPPQLMLVTPATGDDPARADWLIRHAALSILPAISALTPPAAGGPAPGRALLAFADPDFGALAAQTPLALRGGLAPLPETAEEVRDVAAALGAGDAALRLGEAATEAAVKAADLGQVGLLYFATHGLVSGDAVGAAALEEPALALTPGGGEDGFLTASEIAELHLNARFVVLSACNTAAGDPPGAEALSGLVQSFLYAGARGLLVSHWPVESRSAVALMTDLFRRRAADPQLPAAEAQRQAMLDMIDNPADPRWSHPAYWAPFILVGQPD
jgi:hypothetical protein